MLRSLISLGLTLHMCKVQVAAEERALGSSTGWMTQYLM